MDTGAVDTVAAWRHMAVRPMAPARAAAEDAAGEAMAMAAGVTDPAVLVPVTVTSRKQYRMHRPLGGGTSGCGAYLRTIPD
jgi:hypothetical protein